MNHHFSIFMIQFLIVDGIPKLLAEDVIDTNVVLSKAPSISRKDEA